MNSQICKRISRHTDVVLYEYFYNNRTLRLSFYSPKWVRKTIKKLVNLGRVIEEITMQDLEYFAKKRGAVPSVL